jgi:hypothetical protein
MRTLLMTSMVLSCGLLWATGAEAAPARKPTRCCIMVPAETGPEKRPYCFNIEARPARRARRVCKLVGGEPQRPAVVR